MEGLVIGSAALFREQAQCLLFPGPGNNHNLGRWTCRRFVSQQIRELCGQKYLNTFWDRWEENHLREEDIALMAEMGFNCVRVGLNANALPKEEPGIHFDKGSFARQWGYRRQPFCEYPSVFLDVESKECQIILWEKLARRYDPECHNWRISIQLYGASPEIRDLYPWLLKREEQNVPL